MAAASLLTPSLVRSASAARLAATASSEASPPAWGRASSCSNSIVARRAKAVAVAGPSSPSCRSTTSVNVSAVSTSVRAPLGPDEKGRNR